MTVHFRFRFRLGTTRTSPTFRSIKRAKNRLPNFWDGLHDDGFRDLAVYDVLTKKTEENSAKKERKGENHASTVLAIVHRGKEGDPCDPGRGMSTAERKCRVCDLHHEADEQGIQLMLRGGLRVLQRKLG